LGTTALATDMVCKSSLLAARYSPPLSRYAMALLTRSTTYDTSADQRDVLAARIDHGTGMDRLATWIEGVGGVDEYIRKAK
jgi:hypothetical protein